MTGFVTSSVCMISIYNILTIYQFTNISYRISGPLYARLDRCLRFSIDPRRDNISPKG